MVIMVNQLIRSPLQPICTFLVVSFLFTVTIACLNGCLVSDPDFKPYERDAILASEHRVIITPSPLVVPTALVAPSTTKMPKK